MGGFYWSIDKRGYDSLYCESCGDCDWYLGYAENKEEVLNMIDLEAWDRNYVEEFVESIPFEKEV